MAVKKRKRGRKEGRKEGSEGGRKLALTEGFGVDGRGLSRKQRPVTDRDGSLT